MIDNDNQDNQGKTDWSLTESVMRSEKTPAPEREQIARPIDRAELVPAGNSIVPPAPNVALPDTSNATGIMMQWKENKLARKATLRALEAHYDSQLDALTHSLTKAVQVQKARADVLAEEYLKELDSRQLEMLTELGLRNKETRERALVHLTDMTVAKIKEVQGKDWPSDLIRETISHLLALRKRVVSEMMKELGGEYSEE